MAEFQKIEKRYDDPLVLAYHYYTIICKLNNIKVTNLQLKLLAFCAVRGSVYKPGRREEFMKLTGAPANSVYNLVYQLCKKRLLQKTDNGDVMVLPSICPNFKDPTLLLSIKMYVSETTAAGS